MRKLLLAAALALAAALPVCAQTQDDTGAQGVFVPDRTATGTLGSLNATASVRLTGRGGAGVFISTSNLNATVVAEVSLDGGTTWTAVNFVGPLGAVASSLSFGGGSATQQQGIVLIPGTTNVRVRVSVYTSGTASATIRAGEAEGAYWQAVQAGTWTVQQGGAPWSVSISGTPAVTISGTVAATQSGTWSIRAQDGAGNALASSTSSPAGTEQALIVRNVPSGTQAVSAASLPLPSGAAQEHTTAGSPHAARLTDGSAFYKATTPSDTQPISAASLPLPTGAATAANQDGIIRDGTGDTTQANVTSGRLNVDGSGVTQPVSGTVTANAGSGTFTVSGTVTANAGSGTLGTNVAQVGGTSTATNAGDASAGTIRTVQAGAPTVAYGQVSCGTTATSIAAARAGRRAINVTLLASGTDVYFGDASVTTAAGDKLLGIDGAARSYATSAALYCRVASGSVSVSYMEIF